MDSNHRYLEDKPPLRELCSAGCRPVPSNRARQKARQPALPCPRTRSSNPVPSSGESTNFRFPVTSASRLPDAPVGQLQDFQQCATSRLLTNSLSDFSRTRFRPAKRAKPLGQRAAQVEHIRATSMRAGRKARTLPKAYLRISRAEARRARFRSRPPRYPRRPCHNPSPRDAAYPLGRAATLHEPTVEHGWLAPGSGLRGP